MRAGELRDLVDIEQPSEADGDPVPAFSGSDRLSLVPCNIVMTGGSETFRGRGIEPTANHVVEMRYYAGITPRMRLRVKHGMFAGRVLNVTAVVPVDEDRGRLRLLQLDCREEVAT